MLLEEVINMSSGLSIKFALLSNYLNNEIDWIAHGVLDSIVDSFFPFLEEIEKEVLAIEDIVSMAAHGDSSFDKIFPVVQTPMAAPTSSFEHTEKGLSMNLMEKPVTLNIDPPRTRFSPPRLTLSLAIRRFRRTIDRSWRYFSPPPDDPLPSATHNTLRRMARTRRLVTTLARLLATKSEVVAQIRKRLLTSGKSGLNGSAWNEDLDVAIYMGDVQGMWTIFRIVGNLKGSTDHILTLQLALAHYERMLSQSHPTYLSQLRAGVAVTKIGTDKAIIYLTVVGVAVLCVQTLIGMYIVSLCIQAN